MELAEDVEPSRTAGPLSAALLVAAMVAAGVYAGASGLATALGAGLNAAASRGVPVAALTASGLFTVGQKPVTPTDSGSPFAAYPGS